jgi:predicted nuclease of predicted toxin-antitoxin system
VKLLLDENLAPRLAADLGDLFPGSIHVRSVGLLGASDLAVWEYARREGFAIVSKDWDFQQLSYLHGAPPKVVWIRRGNCTTTDVSELLRSSARVVHDFGDDEVASLLILS